MSAFNVANSACFSVVLIMATSVQLVRALLRQIVGI